MDKEKKRFIWTAKVSDKGQIAIPKEAREVFNIKTGDTLLLFGDLDRGIAISKADNYLNFADSIYFALGKDKDNE